MGPGHPGRTDYSCVFWLSDKEILEVIGLRDTGTEVVITGRYASEALLALADLVTEMREVKHYYTRGVLSRDGFDH